MKTGFLLFVIILLLSTLKANAQQTIPKLITKEFEVQSTTKGAKPCPVMTEAQRDAIGSPISGQCIYNSTSLKLNVYNGTLWKAAGGGIENWQSSFNYAIGDVVIESFNIYQANTAHTSSESFASDIANWDQLAKDTPIDLTSDVGSSILPLANGGTSKNITASSGAIVYSDADSLELSSVGTIGQVLQSNGTSAPSFVNKSISGKAQESAAVTLEELRAPNNLLTEVDTNKYLYEGQNKNILSNPSFEHSIFSTSWTSAGTGTDSEETSVIIDGKKSFKIVTSSQTIDLQQGSALYQAQFADGVQGVASVRIKTDHTGAMTVCSRQAGTCSTTNCVSVSNNNTWGFYKVPFVLGGTSNGICISGASGTGTTYIDDAFVGAQDLEQDVSVQTDYIRLTNGTTRGSSNSSIIYSIVTKNTNTGVLQYSTSGTLGTQITALKKATVGASLYVVAPNSTGSLFSEIKLNGTSIAASEYFVTNTAENNNTISVNIVMEVGDILTFPYGTNPSDSTLTVTGTNVINANTYSSSCGANCVDTFSAKISSTGTTSEENAEFITGNASKSTSIYTITLNGFTVTPNCWVTPANGNTVIPRINSLSSTTLVVATFGSTTGTANDGAFTVGCQKQGADFVATRTIVGSFKDVPTTPSTITEKYYRLIAGGASLTTPCTASPCTLYRETKSGWATVTRSASGTYSVAFDSSVQNARVPKCSITSTQTGNICYYRKTSVTASTFDFISRDCANTAVDDVFWVDCKFY